jgi:GH15 family glucan-1,4-alpha-glucosidase
MVKIEKYINDCLFTTKRWLKMIEKSISILKNLQSENGLFSASSSNVTTGYHRAWIRDNIYEALGLEVMNQYNDVIMMYQTLLDILLKHEYKIDWAIKEKPDAKFKYIHPRYEIDTLNEIHEEWGNKQNDAIGALLFKIGELESKNIRILRNDNDLRIIKKLIDYLASIEYWHDLDNGIWEENEEVHASSVGACVAGLKKISKIINVPKWLIKKGEETLNNLLPRESLTKDVDLALLSLIYPYNIVSKDIAKKILHNIETKLVRKKGVIRYKDDYYYNNGIGEAEWTMGFPWLAIIYYQMNNNKKYYYYLAKSIMAINKKGELPELYYGKTNKHNENSPLGWSQALFIVMCSKSNLKYLIELFGKVYPILFTELDLKKIIDKKPTNN